MNKKVLMISHAYPPIGGSGMLRVLKFTRYLPETGWQPIVLTLKKTNHLRIDPELLSEIPYGTKIYRSFQLSPVNLLLKFYNVLKKFFFSKTEFSADVIPISSNRNDKKKNIKLVQVIKEILTIPDKYIGWYLPGLLTGLYAVIRNRPDVIYSTSPPATAQLIGYSLSFLTGIPLVVDFRDPWTLQYPKSLLNRVKYRWNRKLEAKVLSHASKVICNTEQLREAFYSTYPQLEPNRFCVITNGFDTKDFEGEVIPPPAEGPFKFIHTGEFFPWLNQRVPDPFLIALKELIDKGIINKADVFVHFVGSGEYALMKPFLDLVNDESLKKVVKITDFVPHRQIAPLLKKSHVLLLFQNGEHFRMQIPAKVFEYISASRNIMAIACPGATASIVNSLKGGWVIEPQDKEKIKSSILELIIERQKFPFRSEKEIFCYDRKVLTKKLAKLLESINEAKKQKTSA